MGNCSKKAIFLQLGIKTARRARKRGIWGIHKTNYVVKTTELGRKPRAGRGNVGVFGNHKMNYVVKTTEFGERSRGGDGEQVKNCADRGMPRKKCAKNAPRTDAAFLFLGCVCKMGQAAACWRAKSGDGGGNRRTSAKKNTRDRCAVFPGGMQMGNARKGTRPPVQRRGRR